MILINEQITGNSYIRNNSVVMSREYMGYAGSLESMHTENTSYFSRSTVGLTWGKPVLKLKSVCWMNPYAIVENIPIPNREENVVNLFFYHKYGPHFRMNNQLVVHFAEHGGGKFNPDFGEKDFVM